MIACDSGVVPACFAGNAEAKAGMHDFPGSGGTGALPAPQLNRGIAVGPLIDNVRAVMDVPGPMHVDVIGDGRFDEAGWVARLLSRAKSPT